MGGAFPEVVATELRVEAVTVELLPRLRPKLLPLLILEETLTTGLHFLDSVFSYSTKAFNFDEV